MDLAFATVGLLIALAVVMFGLGLGFTGEDFSWVAQRFKVVVVALVCQLVLFLLICFGLVVLADLSALLGIGMMLFAVLLGGTTVNLFSYLFYGDVVFNITLIVVNLVVSIVTLPIVIGLAIVYYDRGHDVFMFLGEVVKVFVIILVFVAVGMLVCVRNVGFAVRMDWPVRMLSAVLFGVIVVGILVDERKNVGDYVVQVGLIAVVFCVISLVVGYVVPKVVGVFEKQAIVSSFEIGVHNGTLVIFVAVEVFEVVIILVLAVVYLLVMVSLAAIWGLFIFRRVRWPLTVS